MGNALKVQLGKSGKQQKKLREKYPAEAPGKIVIEKRSIGETVLFLIRMLAQILVYLLAFTGILVLLHPEGRAFLAAFFADVIRQIRGLPA